MKTKLMFIFLLTATTSCDQGKALEAGSCVIQDSKLSVAFKNPNSATKYLRGLSERLKAKDEEAIHEAADLVSRLADCVPE